MIYNIIINTEIVIIWFYFQRTCSKACNTSCCFIFVSEVCSAPNETHVKVVSEQKDIYKPGDEITITQTWNCGYATFNFTNGTTTCQRTRAWLSNPDCKSIFCNDTSDVNHNSIQYLPVLGNGENGIVSYNSERFYLKSGSVEVTCLNSRKLSWVNVPELGKTITDSKYTPLIKMP